jgi:chemotaxis protein CheX
MSMLGTSGPAVAAEDVAGIAEAVWQAYLGELGDIRIDEPGTTAIVAGDDVFAAYVLVGGAWQGGVMLCCGTETAERLASAMLGVPVPVDTTDVGDAIGELANVLGGNVKSLVPQPSAISLPVVTLDTEHGPAAGGREICLLDLTWQGDSISVRVWTREEVR